MKKLIPWLCLMGTVQMNSAQATQEGIDAYREGRYWQAAAEFAKSSTSLDPVSQYYLGRMKLYGYGELKNNTQGLQAIKTAAERGYVPALIMMGRMALNQDHNPTEALKWFKKAAEANNLYAQLYCIAAYKNGFGASKNLDLVERYSIAAAKKGNVLAQYTLGQVFINGKYSGNRRVGVAWLEKAANKQYPPALYALGQLYASGTLVKKDEIRAQNLLNAAQAKGYTPPANNEKTSSTAEIEKEVAQWLTNDKETTLTASGYGFQSILNDWFNSRALAENIYNPFPHMEITTKNAIFNPRFELIMPNQISLLDYYDAYMQSLKSDHAQLDEPKYPLVMPAVTDRLIEKAILGDSTAQFALGQLYQQGVGVDKDIEKAIQYYNQSVAQYDLRAEYNLGLLYLHGETGKPDYQQAIGWLTDAAFKGSAEAQYVLGQILAYGYRDAAGNVVIPEDKEQATAMFYLGAANRHGLSQYQLAELISREPTQTMTVAEKEKRFKLLQSLYQDATTAGVKDAAISLAFFQAMSSEPSEREKAFQIASKGAEEDNKTAILLLGLLYDRGIGTESSHNKAMSYYKEMNHNPVTAFILGTYAAADHDSEGEVLLKEAEQAQFSYAPLNLAILQKQNNQDFLPQLLKARELGSHSASILLADYYLTQAGHQDNQFAEARLIFQQVAEKGDKEGQLKLGYMFEQGLGGAVDYKEAARWYELAAKSGQPIAQYRLARLNQLGLMDNQPDYSIAKQWYRAAMNQQYVPAAIALGFIHDTVNDDYSSALAEYTIAANKGSTIGQFNLGLMYELGKGVPSQFDKAEALYLQAAEKDFVPAMVQLAGLYWNGVNGDRDEKKALNWYQKAADKGDQQALYYLGLFAETGVGTALDYAAAVRYYQAASQKGNAQAMLALARMYQYGQGVAQNYSEAELLYKQLLALGNAYAAYQLATMAYEGALGEQNKSQAQQWLKLAAQYGSREAQQTLLWLSAQSDTRVSFIEPIIWTSGSTITAEPVHWQYLGAVNAWNQGNEVNFKQMLNQLLQANPNYAPAKEAYQHVLSAEIWNGKQGV